MTAAQPDTGGPIRYEQPLPHVVRIVLARPSTRNAQNREMLHALDDAYARAVSDPQTRVVILAADGPDFSSGHDLTENWDMAATQPRTLTGGFTAPGAEGWFATEEELFTGLCLRWRDLPRPVIAQVQGRVIAGGLMLVWPCDLVVAAEDATFADPVGAFDVNGAEYFTHLWELGARRAKQLLFTGDAITAQEAQTIGMVNEVVPATELETSTLALAARIARRPPFGIRLAKRAINQGLDLQGQRSAVEAAFGLHHLAHTHNRLLHDQIVDPGGRDVIRESAAQAARPVSDPNPPHPEADSPMTDPHTRIDELVRRFTRPGSSAADLLCDSHPADAVAFTVIEPDLSSRDLTYGELRAESTKFAAALAGLGIGPGDAVAVLMGKSAELVVTLLGIWRRGAIQVPLFTAFAPPAIELRIGASGAKVVVADADQCDKLNGIVGGAGPRLVVMGGRDSATDYDDFDELLDRHDGAADAPAALGPDGVLIELFTSGTTGAPKAVQVPVRALAAVQAYLECGLDLRADDVYWNAADPGWAYGLYYAVLGPLAAGRRSLLLRAPFSPSTTWQILERFGVSNFAAAPTVYRSLQGAGPVPSGLALRCLSSAGEPLTPDVVAWSESVLGVAVRDHYGQTEQGMMIGNAWADEVREPIQRGSMGRVLPGWSAAVLVDGSTTPAPAGTIGQVAVDVANSPLATFRGYARASGSSRFSDDGRWYLTGDTATQNEDGFFRFSARDDDVIIMAGYRIGPFEVESVLLTHPKVAEVAAVGRPDELRGEVLEAHVVLVPGTEGTPELERELQQLVKDQYAKHAYPRAVHFADELPKTPSGKIQRFLLRRGG